MNKDKSILTVEKLREIVKNLPGDTIVDMFNDGSEWYGVEPVVTDMLKIIDGRLVINYGGSWGMYDRYPEITPQIERYRKERDKG